MLYWPEEFLLKDKLLSLWGSDCMILMSLHLLLLNIFFFLVCLNCQCLIKLFLWDVTLRVHPVWNILLYWYLGSYFLPHLMEVFQFCHLKNFLKHQPLPLPFFFLFSCYFFFFCSFPCGYSVVSDSWQPHELQHARAP